MGAKTTQFMGQIQGLTGDCQNAALAVANALSQFLPVKQSYHELTVKSAARVTELTGDKQWVAGSAPAKFAAGAKGMASEQYIETDPKFKALDASMVAMEARLHTWMSATQTAKKGLAAKVSALRVKVDEFEKYVKAKEAKWLTGKKSIPAAKEVIKTARQYIKDFAAAAA